MQQIQLMAEWSMTLVQVQVAISPQQTQVQIILGTLKKHEYTVAVGIPRSMHHLWGMTQETIWCIHKNLIHTNLPNV